MVFQAKTIFHGTGFRKENQSSTGATAAFGKENAWVCVKPGGQLIINP